MSKHVASLLFSFAVALVLCAGNARAEQKMIRKGSDFTLEQISNTGLLRDFSTYVFTCTAKGARPSWSWSRIQRSYSFKCNGQQKVIESLPLGYSPAFNQAESDPTEYERTGLSSIVAYFERDE